MTMESIIVSHLSDKVTHSDLVKNFTDGQNGGNVIQYVLYPLAADITKALVAFQNAKAVHSVLKHKHIILGQHVKVQPAPRQAYQTCTAEVDPLLLATIENPEKCLKHLEKDFGLRLIRDRDNSISIQLQGSFLQIQSAQAVLDQEYCSAIQRQQQEIHTIGLTSSKHLSHHHLEIWNSRYKHQHLDESFMSDLTDDEMSVVSMPAMHIRPHKRGHLDAGGASAATSYDDILGSRTENGTSGKPDNTRMGSSRTSGAAISDSGTHWKNDTKADLKSQLAVPEDEQFEAEKKACRDPLIQAQVVDQVQSAPIIRPANQYLTEASLPSLSQKHSVMSGSQVEGDPSVVEAERHGNYLTLKLDGHILNYMYKVQKRRIAEIEKHYDVKVSIDDGNILIEPARPKGANVDALAKAKQDLVSIYRDVYYNVVKEEVSFDPEHLQRDVLEAVITAVKKAFSKTMVFGDLVFTGSITLVGEWKHVSVAADWIREKLALKKTSARRSKKQQGLHSEMLLDSTGKPKMMLVMDSNQISKDEAKEHIKERMAHLSREKQRSGKDERLTKSMPSSYLGGEDVTSPKNPRDEEDQHLWRSNVIQSSADDKKHESSPLKQLQQEMAEDARKYKDDFSLETPREDHTAAKRGEGLDQFLGFSSTRDVIAKTSVANDHQMPGAFPVEDNNWWEVMEMVSQSGVLVRVCHGDITKANVEAVVSAANDRLHNIGGVARAIAYAAGPEFDTSCMTYVAKYGYLKVGEVISIPVQRSHLSWSNVLLAVGPMWCLYVNKDVCAQMLCETFKNILNYAGHVLKLKSLAMPAISTGIYGVPVDICANALYNAIQSCDGSSSLHELLIVTLDEETTEMISIIFQQLEEAHKEAGYETDTSSFFQDVKKTEEYTEVKVEEQTDVIQKKDMGEQFAKQGKPRKEEMESQEEREVCVEERRDHVEDGRDSEERKAYNEDLKTGEESEGEEWNEADKEDYNALLKVAEEVISHAMPRQMDEEDEDLPVLKRAIEGLESDDFDVVKKSDSGMTFAPMKHHDVQSERADVKQSPTGSGIQSPTGSNVQSPRGSSVQSPRGSIVQSPRGSIIQSPRGSIVQSPRGSIVQSPRGSIVQSPRGSIVQSPRGSIVQSPRGSGIQSPREGNVQSLRQDKILSPREIDVQSPRGSDVQSSSGSDTREATQSPRGADIQSPRGSRVHSSEGSKEQSPRGSDFKSLTEANVQSPRGADVQSSRGSGVQSPRGSDFKSPREANVQSLREADVQSSRRNGVHSPGTNNVQSPRGTDISSPRGRGIQSPRAVNVQSPRTDNVESPRGSDISSSRGRGIQSFRMVNVQSPRGSEVHSSIGSGVQSPRGRDFKSPREVNSESPRTENVQSPRGSEVHSPRTENVQSPRGSEVYSPRTDNVQSPRGSEVHSPRTDNVRSPRGSEVHSPRTDNVQSPRGSEVHSPRTDNVQSPRGSEVHSHRTENVESLGESDIYSPRGRGIQSPRMVNVQSPRGSGVQSPRGSGVQSPRRSGVHSSIGSGIQSPRGSDFRSLTGIQSPRMVNVQSPQEYGTQSSRVSGGQSPRTEDVQSPRGSGFVSPRGLDIQSPRVSGLTSPRERSTSSPEIVNVQSLTGNDVQSPKADGVLSPRGSESASPRGRTTPSPRIVNVQSSGSHVQSPREVDE